MSRVSRTHSLKKGEAEMASTCSSVIRLRKICALGQNIMEKFGHRTEEVDCGAPFLNKQYNMMGVSWSK